MAKQAKGGTPATVALTRAGVAFTAHTYHHDPTAASYGLEAAEALGISPDRVFKTLFVELDADRSLAVAIVPVSGQLDLKAMAAASGAKKAQMADPTVAERASGYVVGGISPVGQRRQHPTVLDESAFEHPTIFVSGGRRGLDLEIEPRALADLLKAGTAAIGRPSPGRD